MYSDDLKNVKIFYTNFSQSEKPDLIAKTIDENFKNIKFELSQKIIFKKISKN